MSNVQSQSCHHYVRFDRIFIKEIIAMPVPKEWKARKRSSTEIMLKEKQKQEQKPKRRQKTKTRTSSRIVEVLNRSRDYITQLSQPLPMTFSKFVRTLSRSSPMLSLPRPVPALVGPAETTLSLPSGDPLRIRSLVH